MPIVLIEISPTNANQRLRLKGEISRERRTGVSGEFIGAASGSRGRFKGVESLWNQLRRVSSFLLALTGRAMLYDGADNYPIVPSLRLLGVGEAADGSNAGSGNDAFLPTAGGAQKPQTQSPENSLTNSSVDARPMGTTLYSHNGQRKRYWRHPLQTSSFTERGLKTVDISLFRSRYLLSVKIPMGHCPIFSLLCAPLMPGVPDAGG